MWEQTFSKTYTGVTTDQIWAAWIDFKTWPKWHSNLDYIKSEGPFKKGSYYIFKLKDFRAVKPYIVEVSEGKGFTDCSKLWGAQFFFTHMVTKEDKTLTLTNTLRLVGPFAWFWKPFVIKKVAHMIPGNMDALVNYVKGRSK